MKGPFASTDTLKDYLDVSVHTIRQWVRDSKIPRTAYLKIGNTYRFHIGAVQDALMNYDDRKKLTPKERDALALSFIEQAALPPSDKPEGIPEEVVSLAEENLERQVHGLQPLREHVEVDSELESILDEHDNLEDI